MFSSRDWKAQAWREPAELGEDSRVSWPGLCHKGVFFPACALHPIHSV